MCVSAVTPTATRSLLSQRAVHGRPRLSSLFSGLRVARRDVEDDHAGAFTADHEGQHPFPVGRELQADER
jgi:hypothetical protein